MFQDSQDSSAPSLKRLGQASAALLLSHLELFGIELQEEKARFVKIGVLFALSIVFALLALFAASALVLIYFWDTHRLAAAGALLAFYVVALVLSICKVSNLFAQASNAFSATRQELARHRELLP